MERRYRAYPEYTYVNDDIMRKIPKHWDSWRVRFLLHNGAEGIKIGPFGSALKLEDMVESGIKVYGQENVIGRNFSLGERSISTRKYDEMQVYKVKPGDLLVTMMGTIGRCEIVPIGTPVGIIDSHLLRLRVNASMINPRFFRLLLDECHEVKSQVEVSGKGSIMHGLNSSIVKGLSLPLPPLSEQECILNFLNHETAKIDTLIEKQQQLIALLGEKRQAVISHAVTKGLNPDAPMKDSGVEWLGEVPAHWIVGRAKSVSEIFVPQRNKPELNDSDGVVWITMEDMKRRTINSGRLFVNRQSMETAGSKVLQSGSVIASCVGNFGVTSINEIDVVINQQLQAFMPTHISPEYLSWLVSISKAYFDLIGTTATLVYVNQQGFENLPIVKPPQAEQNEICSFIDQQYTRFDELIEKAEQAIELLQERRTALISAAVTGKIDVRNWQPPTNKDIQ